MNTYNFDDMLKELQNKLGAEQIQTQENQFLPTLLVSPTVVPSLIETLRDQFGFNHLANLTSVDYVEEFELVYHLFQIPGPNGIAIKSRVSREEAKIESVTSIFTTADWQEREVYDLMGIQFTGHPNLVRVLLPDDFEGHPLRKDFKRREWQDVISELKGD